MGGPITDNVYVMTEAPKPGCLNHRRLADRMDSLRLCKRAEREGWKVSPAAATHSDAVFLFLLVLGRRLQIFPELDHVGVSILPSHLVLGSEFIICMYGILK